MITVSESVFQAYPSACFGALVAHGLATPTDRARMDALESDVLAGIRAAHATYERKAFAATAPACHYVTFYKQFTKTYHVLLQLESVLLKGKGIPPAGVPIEMMFLAELKNLLLTAVHDMDAVEGALTVRVATGDETYTGMSGEERHPYAGDLYLADESGILSDIVYGPDARTQITDTTATALYFVFGVEGITADDIRRHLEDVRAFLTTGLPEAVCDPIEVFHRVN